MKRHTVFAQSAILCFLFTIALVVDGSCPAFATAQLKGSRPNIILIITDDQGYGPVGRHGHPWIETPAMDQLYDQSIRFTTFLVCPTCAPTRSAMMTGRHPMKNGVTHTILERERMTLDATTLPQALKTVGYQTGIFGKWHLGDEDDYQPQNRGFDEAFIHGAGGIGQAYNCSCADVPNNKYFDPVIRHNGKFVKTRGFCTDIFFSAAMGWIKQASANEKPFFAYITTNAPHAPFVCKESDAKRFKKMGFKKAQAGFYGMIENIDDNIGRLLKKLDEWDIRKDTLIIFMSDNGMASGSGPNNKPIGTDSEGNAVMSYNAGMKGQKGTPHEGGVRVPFFVSWPEKIKKPANAKQLTAHIDIFPTLAEMAGAELPDNQVEGRSLVPILENTDADWTERYLFTHVARWKTGANPDDFKWKRFAIRNSRFRMVGEKELYDMIADPGQSTNVIEKHPEVVKQMRQEYEQFWREAKPLMVNEDAPMSKTKPFHEAYRAQLESTGIPEWNPPKL